MDPIAQSVASVPPRPCLDCIEIRGDTAESWLAKWPQGAEWHADFSAYLCDGCADERRDGDQCAAERDACDEFGQDWIEPEATYRVRYR